MATTLISTVGGASGPLYGTAFLRAATSAGDAPTLDAAAVRAALAAARDGVVARGKAEPGDKTMVDALSPAVEAASGRTRCRAAPGGGGRGRRRRRGHRAAEARARDGPPTWVSAVAGHPDPGATSTALILRAFAEAASK